MTPARVAYIHAGTHKTGTTSVQAMLAENDAAFAAAGIYIPQTARITPTSAGHHNLAWQLNNEHQFNPAGGTLEEAFAEIARANLPTVCVSSEEFEFLGAEPNRLRALYDGFAAIGYEPRAILYLRPQADYLESLYAEIVKRWTVDFADFLGSILSTGIYGESRFDYAALVGSFAGVFGTQRLYVRAYHAAAPSGRLLDEFVAILCSGGRHTLDTGALRRPRRLNPMLNCDELLSARLALTQGDADAQRAAGIRLPSASFGGRAFAPLTLLEIVRIVLRFWPSNDRVARRYGVRVNGASPGILQREIVTVLTADGAGRQQKRLIRALDQSAATLHSRATS